MSLKRICSGAVMAATLLGVLLLGGCGNNDEAAGSAGKADSSGQLPPIDNTAEVQQYYRDHPEFFAFKTTADIPAHLIWENGADEPELGSPQARRGGTQYSALQDFPRTMRLLGPDSNGGFRTFLQDDTVIRLALLHPDTRKWVPGLAEEWAVDYEAKTVYVRLDPTARWSDGMPVTVEDMFFTFFMYQSPYILAPWYNNWYSKQYTNITRYDERTFSISVPERKPDMDGHVLALAPLPQHFFRELGEDFVERYQWRVTPTTGAYTVREEDIRKGRSIALSRVENWWANERKHFRYRFNPQRIQFSVIRDSAKTFEAFKRGDIDIFGLNLAEYWYDKLPDSDPDVQAGYIHKVTFYNQFPRPPFGLWINTAKPLLDNRDIRIGINHASNWQLVIDKFFRGDHTRLRTANDGFGEFSNAAIEPRPFDLEAAREHFARAGFTRSGSDGVLMNEAGERLSFGLTSGYEAYTDVLTILREEAMKAGLELRVEVLDSTAAWKKVQEKKHDIAFTAFGGFLEMYPRYWETQHSDNAYDKAFLEDGSVNPQRVLKTQTNNLESLALPEFDRLIEAYRSSDDKQEMIELAHRMDTLHAEHASFVPGFAQDHYRLGFWRWVKFPEGFNARHSSAAGEYFLHWIDEELREQTRAAQRSGQRFEPQILVFDQYREQ